MRVEMGGMWNDRGICRVKTGGGTGGSEREKSLRNVISFPIAYPCTFSTEVTER